MYGDVIHVGQNVERSVGLSTYQSQLSAAENAAEISPMQKKGYRF